MTVMPRPSILAVEPYVGGESKIPGVNRIVKLSSNEGAFGPPPGAVEAIRKMATEAHRYPDGGAKALREAIGAAHGLDPARIVCGNGSDELIALLIMAYGGEGTELVMSAYGFQMYELTGLWAGCRVIKVPERELTADVDAMGTLRLLEAIRFLGLEKKTRFYQASTSELYGLVQEIPQKETTPFYPRSPYAVAKLYAYWITVNYREAYGMYACNGILFNHESPRRGETFVTRKITRGLANIAQGLEQCLFMGNMDALRDWGHAKDYVRMQWMMLQQEQPEDFVIATGVQYSVREFIRWSAAELGLTLEFTGTGVEEVATVTAITGDKAPDVKAGQVIMRIDPRYFRPAEVETLLGDPTKAKEKLGWVPEITAQEMCAEMVAEDLQSARRHRLLREHGFSAPVSVEA